MNTSTGPDGAAYTSAGIPGRRQAGRSPTRVPSWWRSCSALARARACASEPPTLESSFFAMTMRIASLGERLVDVGMRVRERSCVGVLNPCDHLVPVPALAELRPAGPAHREP